MLKNSHMLDANAVLRFLLQDIEEQFRQVKDIVKKDRCYVTLEVMAEVCYIGGLISGFSKGYSR